MAKKMMSPLTLNELLKRSCEQFPYNIALQNVEGTKTISYTQLSDMVDLIQEQLIAGGIVKGDKVALYSENMPNWVAVYFAVTTMGAVVVPILPDFHENEVRHIIRHAECRAVFVSQKLYETVNDASLEHLELVVHIDTLELDEKLSSAEQYGMVHRHVEKLKKGAKALIHKEDDTVSEDDLAAIIYTSGTTGSSKGVMLDHRALAFQVIASQTVFDIESGDRFLSILPLAHTFECSVGMLIPLFNGASVYYLDKLPTPRILIDAMAKVKPTVMLSVPLVIEKIFKNRIQPTFTKNFLLRTLYHLTPVRKLLHYVAGKKLIKTFGGSLRFYGIGGAPISPTVEAFLKEAGFPYAIGYGLTETAPLLAGASPFKTKLRAVGPSLDGIELKIVDPNENGEGTIYAKGLNIMLGYYKNPDKTSEVLYEDGWFNTEDLGTIGKDGYLRISGRSKNVILGPSGENIYPEQIEAIIAANEFVEDALVFEDQSKLCARVYLDYEKLDNKYGIKKLSERQVHEKIEKLLETIKIDVNEKVSRFSKLSTIIEQREPFIKTPTKKIKRYLYVGATS